MPVKYSPMEAWAVAVAVAAILLLRYQSHTHDRVSAVRRLPEELQSVRARSIMCHLKSNGMGRPGQCKGWGLPEDVSWSGIQEEGSDWKAMWRKKRNLKEVVHVRDRRGQASYWQLKFIAEMVNLKINLLHP
jgi:hypothetical protein